MKFPQIVLDPSTYDEVIVKVFAEIGYEDIPTSGNKWIRIWGDISLYFALVCLDIELELPIKLKYNYYSDTHHSKNIEAKLTRQIYNGYQKVFFDSYQIGYDSYDTELKRGIYPLSETDERKKMVTLRMEAHQRARILLHAGREERGLVALSDDALNYRGKLHGLYSAIRSTMGRHGWKNEDDEDGPFNSSSFEKIDLTSKMKINELTTYLIELSETGKIQTTTANLARVILAVFSKEGKDLKPSTIETYFKKSKRDDFRSKK